jgi:hypothetical protein
MAADDQPIVIGLIVEGGHGLIVQLDLVLATANEVNLWETENLGPFIGRQKMSVKFKSQFRGDWGI